MSISSQLNVLINLLVNQYYIYKFFHWNFEGEDFYSYHHLFDSHASKILQSQDAIAEHIRTFQTKVILEPELTAFKGFDTNQKNLFNILTLLTSQHKQLINEITEIIKLANFSNYFSTADLLIDYLEEQQKMLWVIESSNK
jgi:starvation-inducible DNA-binding protein